MCETDIDWLPPEHVPTGDGTNNLGMYPEGIKHRTLFLMFGIMLQPIEPSNQNQFVLFLDRVEEYSKKEYNPFYYYVVLVNIFAIVGVFVCKRRNQTLYVI